MQYVLLVVAIAFIIYRYRGRRDTTAAPASIARDGSEIDAVEFYWRPG